MLCSCYLRFFYVGCMAARHRMKGVFWWWNYTQALEQAGDAGLSTGRSCRACAAGSVVRTSHANSKGTCSSAASGPSKAGTRWSSQHVTRSGLFKLLTLERMPAAFVGLRKSGSLAPTCSMGKWGHRPSSYVKHVWEKYIDSSNRHTVYEQSLHIYSPRSRQVANCCDRQEQPSYLRKRGNVFAW